MACLNFTPQEKCPERIEPSNEDAFEAPWLVKKEIPEPVQRIVVNAFSGRPQVIQVPKGNSFAWRSGKNWEVVETGLRSQFEDADCYFLLSEKLIEAQVKHLESLDRLNNLEVF